MINDPLAQELIFNSNIRQINRPLSLEKKVQVIRMTESRKRLIFRMGWCEGTDGFLIDKAMEYH